MITRAKHIFEWLIAISIVFETRTIYLHSDLNISNIFTYLCFALLLLGTLGLFFVNKMSKISINKSYILLIYPFLLLIYFIFRPYSLMEDLFYAISLFLFLFVFMMNSKNGILDKYVKIILLISIVSLFFWLFGLKLGFFKPSGMFYSDWTKRTVQNYYYVFFATQGERNTAIFTEAPMSSLHFSVALLILTFVLKKKRKIFSYMILILAIYSTGAITGYIFILFYLLYILLNYKSKVKLINQLKYLLLIVSIVIVFVFAKDLFLEKLQTDSGGRRLEDLVNCFEAFKSSPIFGIGGGDIAEAKLSGSSNSILRLLAERGLFLGIPYLYCIFKYLHKNFTFRCFVFIALFMFLFVITSMHYTYLMFALLSYFYNYKPIRKKHKIVEKVDFVFCGEGNAIYGQ
ncbi:hypothetical protein [Pseudobutyrivibrio sp.]|uniref:hypothetical protein n=1 Tax=Pseudobutyrivibrio sp. TaxID=2014367 RepID=UPI001B3E7380|nr:hypothetical protein [Pseudobutyrivibrio sp.]MBP3263704.1 hypothetical protein [Pseudobutyrivibrio sp.]